MSEPITREEVVKALAYLDKERAEKKRFWRDAYVESKPGTVGAHIMVLDQLARQWLEDHPDDPLRGAQATSPGP